MNLAALHAYLLATPCATAAYPFGPETLVDEHASPPTIALKCDPAHAHCLRDSFPASRPGYHLNKQHWNTVTLDGSIPKAGLHAMIDESYQLVLKGLTKAHRPHAWVYSQMAAGA